MSVLPFTCFALNIHRVTSLPLLHINIHVQNRILGPLSPKWQVKEPGETHAPLFRVWSQAGAPLTNQYRLRTRNYSPLCFRPRFPFRFPSLIIVGLRVSTVWNVFLCLVLSVPLSGLLLFQNSAHIKQLKLWTVVFF